MTVLKFFLIISLAEFSTNMMTFNPLLTYSIRYKQLKTYGNITSNYTINHYNGKEYINGYCTVDTKKYIDKVIVVIDRCNPEGINCEYFQAWTMIDLCNQIKEKNQIWSSYYSAFDPKLSCPIQGTYKVKNASLDIDQAIKWYSEVINYQWKVAQKLYSHDTYIGSFTMDVSIFSYRKRKNY